MVSISGAGGASSSTSTSDFDKSSLGEPISIVGKLYFTKEQWLACQEERKKGEPSSSTGSRKHGMAHGVVI
jgi:hypothetical protein